MQHSPYEQREKRLKVSRACFTCRVKKIKCDGLQPCMQCKARSRPCSFSKDGKPDKTQLSSDIYPAVTAMNPTADDPPPCSPKPETWRLKSNELISTSQQLDRLGMMWPGEGKEGRWLVDINLLYNGPEKEAPCRKVPLPTIDSNLITLFFRHRYNVFPILPKAIFYRLLENGDPFINQLLLYSMYCNAAHYSHENAPEANTYYWKAKKLLDDDFDTPTLSTIISLCLLSTFESNRHGPGPHVSKNRSSVYSDMALRLCYDLRLHQRYSFHSTGATPDMNELQKRVYWSCYCLDKVQSLVSGRPCLLPSKHVKIDFPMVLRSDDPTEYEINTCFVEHIKLMQLTERILHLPLPDRQTGTLRSTENEQSVLDLDSQLLLWLKNLPHQLQWTPLANDTNTIPTQPPPNSLVAHLHLVYNYVEIYLLQPHTSLRSSSTCFTIQQRCATVATNLTQLTCAMADQPNFIMSFAFISEAIMAALRVHIIECADEKLSNARHARFMFQRSLRSLKSILHHRVIDRILEFTNTIEKALLDADTGNSSSRNSSPKIHMLSPIIPRTTAATSSTNDTLMDERWSSRFNPYGMISPASSTTSGPAEKSIMTRDEELLRPQIQPIYNSMDPYRAPFTIPTTMKQDERPPVCHEQQHMEMYSNLWSKSSLFPANQHLDNAFISSLKPHRLSNSKTTDELYLWESEPTEEAGKTERVPVLYTPQQTGRYGLGVYASAQQHHTDVIRQHMPGLKSNNLNRPVLLNHHGQVVVASNDTMN
ncbi:hypothetical protein INT47_000796 [Mucor saturninus]|uniref:Zn(2)-C6 fungal-type domain-containing protein n=1 Tax=Mucor saturninus TaxID=64648 RepID=A0A8H7RPD4_9FUNG|nr:hypothetical protein INT47_000796 [Mucor saturninus]